VNDIEEIDRQLSQEAPEKCQRDYKATAKSNAGKLIFRMQLPFESEEEKKMKFYELPFEFGEVDKICAAPIV